MLGRCYQHPVVVRYIMDAYTRGYLKIMIHSDRADCTLTSPSCLTQFLQPSISTHRSSVGLITPIRYAKMTHRLHRVSSESLPLDNEVSSSQLPSVYRCTFYPPVTFESSTRDVLVYLFSPPDFLKSVGNFIRSFRLTYLPECQ